MLAMTGKKTLCGAAVVLLLLSGCGSGESGHNAGKAPDRNTSPADVINMPDGFRNVAHKCDGPNMVYVTSHGQSGYGDVSTIAVVANDPRCKVQSVEGG